MRWTLGILFGFALMVAMDAVFVWASVTGNEDIAESYKTEPR